MKLVLLLFLFFLSQNLWALPQLTFDNAHPIQFSFEITDEGLGLVIVEKNQRKTEIKPKFTISDAQKMLITPQKGDRLQKNVELLLVVLSKGAQLQMVQVFVPTSADKLIKSSQTTPICEFENFGDFSWDKPADLKKRVRLIKKGSKSQLELQIGKFENQDHISSVQALWYKCFSF
jgi:hypothetical protein